MTTLYVETSALLAWLFGEPDGERVSSELDAADAVAASTLTFLEIERALVRAVETAVIKEADAARIRGHVASQRASWLVMAVTEAVLARAGRPFPAEPVRTSDAVHLATALAVTEALPDLRMLSVDRRLAKKTSALGL